MLCRFHRNKVDLANGCMPSVPHPTPPPPPPPSGPPRVSSFPVVPPALLCCTCYLLVHTVAFHWTCCDRHAHPYIDTHTLSLCLSLLGRKPPSTHLTLSLPPLYFSLSIISCRYTSCPAYHTHTHARALSHVACLHTAYLPPVRQNAHSRARFHPAPPNSPPTSTTTTIVTTTSGSSTAAATSRSSRTTSTHSASASWSWPTTSSATSGILDWGLHMSPIYSHFSRSSHPHARAAPVCRTPCAVRFLGTVSTAC